jgi:hypothetical protein
MNVEIFLIADAVLGIIFCGGLLLWGWGGSPSPLGKPNVRVLAGRYMSAC